MSERLFALLAAGVGLALLHRVLRRRYDGAVAAATLALLALGSFLLDIVLRPELASAAGSFALGAAAVALSAQAGLPPLRRGLLLGLTAGVAGVLHWPNAALALLAAPRRHENARALGAAVGGAAAVLAVAGGLGVSAFALGPPHPVLATLGSRQGLLHLTPALWLGLAGLALLLRRDARATAAPALAVTVLIALHSLCAGSGTSACPRERLAALLPLLAEGTAVTLEALRALVRRAPAAPAGAAGLLLLGWNQLFMRQYATGMVPRDFPVAFAQVDGNSAALVAGSVGSPLSWPANWAFAWRHDVRPDRFDLASGKRVPVRDDGSIVIDVGRLDLDEALLLEGWSVRHPCGQGSCRALDARARLLLPAIGPGRDLELVVRASGSGWLSASLPGAGARALRLDAALSDRVFHLSPAPRGMAALTLEVTPGGEAFVDALAARALPAEGAGR